MQVVKPQVSRVRLQLVNPDNLSESKSKTFYGTNVGELFDSFLAYVKRRQRLARGPAAPSAETPEPKAA